MDSRRRYIYRQNILLELKSMYRELIADGSEVPTPWERVKMVKTIREWDALTVVPRFGFGSVDNYYESEGAKNHLHALVRPAMMVHSRRDPMVPPHTVEPGLVDANDLFEPRWFDTGGHTFFPRDVDLGRDAAKGIGPQIISWLDQH